MSPRIRIYFNYTKYCFFRAEHDITFFSLLTVILDIVVTNCVGRFPLYQIYSGYGIKHLNG